jgi:hypothetical protein
MALNEQLFSSGDNSVTTEYRHVCLEKTCTDSDTFSPTYRIIPRRLRRTEIYRESTRCAGEQQVQPNGCFQENTTLVIEKYLFFNNVEKWRCETCHRFMPRHLLDLQSVQLLLLQCDGLFFICVIFLFEISVGYPLTPNGHYSGRTAQLTSRRCILNIYSTNVRTEYFKHAA